MSLDYVVQIHIAGIGNITFKEGSGKFRPSTVEREEVDAELPEDGGYTEKNVKAQVQGTALSHPRISVEDLNFHGKNVTVLLKSGKEYMMPGAWTPEAAELSKGEIPITITSNTHERLA